MLANRRVQSLQELQVLRSLQRWWILLRLSVALLAAVCVGCGSSGPSKPDPLDVARDDLETDVAALRVKVDEVKDKIEEFSDGYTDWKDVVSDLQSLSDELDSAMTSVEGSSENIGSEISDLLNPVDEGYDDRDY